MTFSPLIAPPESTGRLGSHKLILIVDDLPDNLQILAGQLTRLGYEIMPASNGPRALEVCRHRKPDLILLDIMMPEMDGFEVCRELKTRPESSDIPIIFLTARTDSDDIVRGLEMGAVDYITKPFKPAELLARVRNHLELKSSRDLLLTYNHQLQRLSGHLRRMNEDKNRLIGVVSNDIRGAFGNVISVSRLLTEEDPIAPNEATDLLRDLGVEAEHMIVLAENLLNIEAIERSEVHLEREMVDPAALIQFATHAHQVAAQARNLTFDVECDGARISGDLTACRQILANLISNAVKYSPDGGVITIRSRATADHVVTISVRDDGPGLSSDDQKKLFEPFTRLGKRSGGHSVGLGLWIVRCMAEHMGGTTRCVSEPGKGAEFSFSLPIAG